MNAIETPSQKIERFAKERTDAAWDTYVAARKAQGSTLLASRPEPQVTVRDVMRYLDELAAATVAVAVISAKTVAMPMEQNGLAKLVEECGELAQVAGKLIGYPHLQQVVAGEANHPDGTNLRKRLAEEMGDVLAAIEFAAWKLRLDQDEIDRRRVAKFERFTTWDRERLG